MVHVFRLVSFLWLWFSVCLMEASWWTRLTEGGTLVFNSVFCSWMELYSLSAIYLGPSYGGDYEDNGDLLQTSHACTATLSTPNPAAGHYRPTLPLDTHRQVWVSLLKGHCSFLLCPGAQGSLFAIQVSVALWWGQLPNVVEWREEYTLLLVVSILITW